MKTHVLHGGEIIKALNDGLARFLPGSPFSTALEIICGHHEKWDGTGYPRQLAGGDIPVVARIAAAADVFDALTSERPYKKAWPFDRAFSYMSEISGSHIDPTVYQTMVRCRSEFETIHSDYV